MTTTDEAAAPAVPAKRPALADPGPLGLAAFALTTFVLSMFNVGALSKGESVVFGLALFYGGLAQLLAGMWEFRNNNTFGALAFTSYGAFWLSFWAYVQFYAAADDSGGKAIGLFLLVWGFFTLYMTIAATRTTTSILAVFILLTITFVLLGLGDMTSTTAFTRVGGGFGLATALAAWYGSFAGVTNSTFGRTVLPVGPRS